MIYHIQLLIDGTWQPFFFIGPDLNDSCQNYRDIRTTLRRAGVMFPCRLKRVTANDQHAILEARYAHPHVAEIINAFCEIKCRMGAWDQRDIDANDDIPQIDED